MIKQGYIQIYTGSGKGKTTAAIGQGIRAIGDGNKVLFLQFMKVANCSEHSILAKLAPELIAKTYGQPCFVVKKEQMDHEDVKRWKRSYQVIEEGNPPKEYVAQLEEGLSYAREQMEAGNYNVVILDEINVALAMGLLSVEKVVAFLEEKPSNVELILTGRSCPEQIIEMADLVTEMREVKHYFHQGVDGRRGIES